MPGTIFDDLEHLDSAETSPNTKASALMVAGLEKPNNFTETCPKCQGTGQFRRGTFVGECFNCRGAGTLTFNTTAAERAKAAGMRQIAKAKAAIAARENSEEYRQANPAVSHWLEQNQDKNEFAKSLLACLNKFGSLTEKQTKAVLTSIARQAENLAERKKNAPPINCDRIVAAFKMALDNGIKRPKLRLGRYTFKHAVAHPGIVYVNEGYRYLGKIMDGQLYALADVDLERKNDIIQTAADPFASAKAHGIRTGHCSCCNRTLTDAHSIEIGIGPVCAERFGWH